MSFLTVETSKKYILELTEDEMIDLYIICSKVNSENSQIAQKVYDNFNEINLISNLPTRNFNFIEVRSHEKTECFNKVKEMVNG